MKSHAHVLSGCSALAQNRYLRRHNAALQVLFYEKLRDLGLSDSVPPWFSCVEPKPLYESPEVKAYWDVLVFAEHEHMLQNRVDVRFIDYKEKKIIAVETSCLWVENPAQKDEEKTLKYSPLRWKLKQQFPGYSVKQFNIIDVLGGWSREVHLSMRELFGARRGGETLSRMQKAVILSSLSIT